MPNNLQQNLISVAFYVLSCDMADPIFHHMFHHFEHNNVLLVKIEGPVWYTIYHHLPVVKGVSKPIY